MALDADRAHPSGLRILCQFDRILDAGVEIGAMMDVNVHCTVQKLEVDSVRLDQQPPFRRRNC